MDNETLKKYTVETWIDDEGLSHMKRTNEGFYPIELLGICQLIAIEVREQMLGNIKPDAIERIVVKNKLEDDSVL